jgi:MoxR-like ATPase
MGYPGYDHEFNLLKLQAAPTAELTPLIDAAMILDLQAKLSSIYAQDSLHHYIVQLSEATRKHPDVLLGASPRASLALMKCARAKAALDGRHYVTHADVQAIAMPVLGHRVILRPEAEIEGRGIVDVITDVLRDVVVLENG